MLQAGRALYLLTLFGLAVTGYTHVFGDLVTEPLSREICARLPQSGLENKLIPHGALWKHETIRQAVAPNGYYTAVGWINVATVYPCQSDIAPALVEIRSLKIYEHIGNTDVVLFEKRFDTKEKEGWDGALFPRHPYWFGPGEGELSGVGIFTKEGFFINARQVPGNIYHGWTDPRVRINPQATQSIELEVRITGNARLQMGMDYWRDVTSDYNGYDPNCQTSNNCEAWIGDWYGDTGGEFITIRAPKNQ